MSVIPLKNFYEEEGILYPIDFNTLSFIPKRTFFVTNVPQGQERGKHAHWETQQLLICIKGSILVKLFDGFNPQTHKLTQGMSIFVDKLTWDSQIYETGDDILLSLCSTFYSKSDYITDLDKFIAIKRSIK